VIYGGSRSGDRSVRRVLRGMKGEATRQNESIHIDVINKIASTFKWWRLPREIFQFICEANDEKPAMAVDSDEIEH
jgi:hypothetical protein